jgi:LysM repeat protein
MLQYSVRLPLSLAGILGVLLVLVALAACTPQTSPVPAVSPSPTVRVILTLYRTPTPTASPQIPTLVPEISFTPAPTPTPVTHQIVKGDTLGGIALRFGVSLENLLAANPGIDPQFLRVGDAIIVPLNDEIPQALPAPTPYPLPTTAPVCYPYGDGGLWCAMLAANPLGEPVENLAGWISLYADENSESTIQAALPPLNLLLPGQSMPLTAYFEPPIPENYQVAGGLVSALPVLSLEGRYLVAAVAREEFVIDSDGQRALLYGIIQLPEDDFSLSTLWLSGVLYGAEEQVVGVRKWDIGKECLVHNQGEEGQSEALDPACLLIERQVYSLGPEIVRVELLVEARP